jgi:hypothetical protein
MFEKISSNYVLIFLLVMAALVVFLVFALVILLKAFRHMKNYRNEDVRSNTAVMSPAVNGSKTIDYAEIKRTLDMIAWQYIIMSRAKDDNIAGQGLSSVPQGHLEKAENVHAVEPEEHKISKPANEDERNEQSVTDKPAEKPKHAPVITDKEKTDNLSNIGVTDMQQQQTQQKIEKLADTDIRNAQSETAKPPRKTRRNSANADKEKTNNQSNSEVADIQQQQAQQDSKPPRKLKRNSNTVIDIKPQQNNEKAEKKPDELPPLAEPINKGKGDSSKPRQRTQKSRTDANLWPEKQPYAAFAAPSERSVRK